MKPFIRQLALHWMLGSSSSSSSRQAGKHPTSLIDMLVRFRKVVSGCFAVFAGLVRIETSRRDLFYRPAPFGSGRELWVTHTAMMGGPRITVTSHSANFSICCDA